MKNFHLDNLDSTSTRSDVETYFKADEYYLGSISTEPTWWEIEDDWQNGGGYLYYFYGTHASDEGGMFLGVSF